MTIQGRMGFRTFPGGNFEAVANWSATKLLTLASPPSGSSQKLTFSVWVKRSTLGTDQVMFDQDTLGSGVLAISRFTTGNAVTLWVDGAGDNVVTTNTFTSTTGWYHIVIAVDTTQATAGNRQKIYVNGSLQSVTGTTYALNDNVLSGRMRWGAFSSANPFGGSMVMPTYVDGQQLTPSSFATAGAPGTVPMAFSGTYGANGHLLTFSNTSSLGTDTSGKGNNFNQNSFTSGDASLQNVFY